MVGNAFKERRKNYPMPEQEMYRLKKIDDYIKEERRVDEKERLIEVKGQKKVWFRVMMACALMNLALLSLAIVGLYQNNWEFMPKKDSIEQVQ